MKKKHSLTLDNEFIQFCKLNNIDDIEKIARTTFNRGFTILKYGEIPLEVKNTPNIVTKEVVKEVIKEIPKEVIKEVIKEIPKEVYITDNELVNENKTLKEEIEKLNSVLIKMNKGTFMKNSNLGSLYDE